jgi:glutamate N-acetyltransferase/amino-acid N-acetyltransferase
MLISSAPGIDEGDETLHGLFEQQLLGACSRLADDVVRNGEGVRHVMRVRVEGAESFERARIYGKAVINSP